MGAGLSAGRIGNGVGHRQVMLPSGDLVWVRLDVPGDGSADHEDGGGAQDVGLRDGAGVTLANLSRSKIRFGR